MAMTTPLSKYIRSLPPPSKSSNRTILDHICKHVPIGIHVAIYDVYPCEPYITALLEEYPYISFYYPRIIDKLTRRMDFFPIANPKGPSPKRIDTFIIPGLVFDARGTRWGCCTSYLDTYLETRHKKALKIGVCLDTFFQTPLPSFPSDVKMNIVVTPTRVHCCE